MSNFLQDSLRYLPSVKLSFGKGNRYFRVVLFLNGNYKLTGLHRLRILEKVFSEQELPC